jgi:hypothetical protein
VAPFVPFESVDRSALRWLKDESTPLVFRLMSGDAAVAELRWAKETGSLATAETAAGTWTIKRGGFLNPHVTIRDSAGGPDLARLSVHLGYHSIHLAGGPEYRLHRAGLLVPAWQVTTADREEVLHLEPVRTGRVLEAGAVVIAPGAKDLRALLLLVILSWHFIVLAWFEDEALVPLEGKDLPN